MTGLNAEDASGVGMAVPRTTLRSILLFLALFAATAEAFAADAQVSVELNKLEPSGDACRAYLVLENGTDRAFETLKLDLVMFDMDGIDAKRLAVETAPLPAGKTSLKVFDIEGLACERLGRLLLNDVLACADASGVQEGCQALVSPSARGATEFIK